MIYVIGYLLIGYVIGIGVTYFWSDRTALEIRDIPFYLFLTVLWFPALCIIILVFPLVEADRRGQKKKNQIMIQVK